VIKGAKPWEAKIYSDDEEIAEIKKGDGPTFKLISKHGREWTKYSVSYNVDIFV
jgi:hypothetical protein